MNDTGKSEPPEEDAAQEPEGQSGAKTADSQNDFEAQADKILKAAADAAKDMSEDFDADEDMSPDSTGQSFAEAIDGTGMDNEEISKALIDNILGEREKLEEEIVELKDKLLRAMAEEQNLRRRMARELEDASKYAVTNFARDMLGVGDNLKRALDHMIGLTDPTEEEADTFRAGVDMTARELQIVFDRHGIKTLEPLGEKFDHNLHQAMFEVPDSGEPDGTVVQVIAAGYTIGGRLLRPAMVGVAKGGEEVSAAPPEEPREEEPREDQVPEDQVQQPNKE